MDFPFISVIMPVFNAEKYLAYSIESVLNQSFTSFEFLIIDDYSSDNSYLIMQKYASLDSRIKLFKNSINKKLPYTLNLGIKHAKGKYIARMDADDISHPDRFAIQVKFMEQNLDIGVCGTWFKVFKDNPDECFREVCYPLNSEAIKIHLYFIRNVIGHPTVMIRRNIIQNNLFNESLSVCEDYDLWLRLFDNKIKFANINKFLLYYRSSDSQITKVHRIAIQKFQEEVFFSSLKKLLKNKPSKEIKKFAKLLSCREYVPFLLNITKYYQLIKVIKQANLEVRLFDPNSFTNAIDHIKITSRLKELISRLKVQLSSQLNKFLRMVFN